MNSAAYLGDGVYAQRDDQGNLWLSTAGHIGSGQEENKICFERTEEDQLLYYLRKPSADKPSKDIPSAFRRAAYAQQEISKLQLGLNWVAENQDLLMELGLQPHPLATGFVDFDDLPREKVLQVIKAFGGKWTKEVQCGRMNYVLRLDNGLALRMYNAELPPSCKLVKEFVTIPEHTEEKIRIECSTGKEIE